MNRYTGVFTAPLAGTYQFIMQAKKVSHFLLLTLNLTILLFTYICVCIIIYMLGNRYVYNKLKYLDGHVLELSLRYDFDSKLV